MATNPGVVVRILPGATLEGPVISSMLNASAISRQLLHGKRVARESTTSSRSDCRYAFPSSDRASAKGDLSDLQNAPICVVLNFCAVLKLSYLHPRRA